MNDQAAVMFFAALGLGGLVLIIWIASVFFRVNERVKLHKESIRLLKKISGE